MATYKDGFHIASAAEMEELLAESMTSGGKTSEQIKAAGALSFSSGGAQRSVSGQQSSTGSLGATASESEPSYTINIDNSADFHDYFWPKFELFGWQRAMLLQLSGFVDGIDTGDYVKPHKESPIEYSLCAANGSGKSKIIIARHALWFISHSRNNIAVITSKSFDQLKGQTFRAIHNAALEINELLGEEYFECTENQVKCPKTKGLIVGVATDRPSRAEGYHPEEDGELIFIADEAKFIEDEMFQAFSRYTGYSAWIEVSSPGWMTGHFYERTMRAESWAIEYEDRNDKLTLGKQYSRRVTCYECPGAIPQHHIDKIKAEDPQLFEQSLLAKFGSIGDSVVIPQETTIYRAPEWNDYKQPLRAGLDLSLGGDETVLSIWHGNKRIAQEIWQITDTKRLVKTLIAAFVKYGLAAENINGDNGGMGKIILQLLRDAGWPLVRINNENPAINKLEHGNRGMEMYWKVKRLIEDQVLILPHADTLCMKQLTTRKFEIKGGRMYLESKKNLSTSPDRSDAMVLAFATVDLAEILLTHKALKDSTKPKFTQIAEVTCPTHEQYEAYIEAKRAKALEGGAGNGLVQHLPVGRVTYSARTSGMAGSRLSTFIKSRKGSGNIPRIGR